MVRRPINRPRARPPPARQPAALQTTTDDRRKQAKQYWPIRRASKNCDKYDFTWRTHEEQRPVFYCLHSRKKELARFVFSASGRTAEIPPPGSLYGSLIVDCWLRLWRWRLLMVVAGNKRGTLGHGIAQRDPRAESQAWSLQKPEITVENMTENSWKYINNKTIVYFSIALNQIRQEAPLSRRAMLVSSCYVSQGFKQQSNVTFKIIEGHRHGAIR